MSLSEYCKPYERVAGETLANYKESEIFHVSSYACLNSVSTTVIHPSRSPRLQKDN